VVNEQLSLFGGDNPTPWTLLRESTLTDDLVSGKLGRRQADGYAGAARLLRDLVRAGLEPDALPVAAVLVAELDREAPSA
jgi:hypothetical protein